MNITRLWFAVQQILSSQARDPAAGDGEEDYDAGDIDGGGNKGTGSDGRVETEGFEEQGQQRSNYCSNNTYRCDGYAHNAGECPAIHLGRTECALSGKSDTSLIPIHRGCRGRLIADR